MNRAIFISYRRDDSEGETGRLYDDLSRAFGADSVFMDVTGINPGVDFRKVIEENVSQCGVLLAVIGPGWVNASGENGQRRLDDANDFVRLEIATALERDVAVIPVLVHEARMPRPDQLPENLKNLAWRNSVELTHARWNSDAQLLIHALTSYVSSSDKGRNRPVHANVPVQLPAPYPRAPQSMPAKRSRMLWIGVACIVLLAAAGAGLWFTSHKKHTANPPAQAQAAQPATTAPATTPPQAQTAHPASTAPAIKPESVPSQTASAATGQSGAAAHPAPSTPTNPDAATQPASRPDPAEPFLGNWITNAAIRGRAPKRVAVEHRNGQLMMHVWGDCEHSPCDWGSQPATLEGGKLIAVWRLQVTDRGQSQPWVAHVALTSRPGGLRVVTHNAFPQTNMRGLWHYDFTRQGGE